MGMQSMGVVNNIGAGLWKWMVSIVSIPHRISILRLAVALAALKAKGIDVSELEKEWYAK
jgi:hypothetical protein